MAKGSQYEREIATKLSIWWSGGKRTDIFWRTAGSGARATTRSKKNKTTSNSHGDIGALHSSGKPLLRKITFEIKRGYQRHTLHDLLDKPKGAATQMYEQWIEKAKASAKACKSLTWMIISKRDRRDALCIMPEVGFKDVGLDIPLYYSHLDTPTEELAVFRFSDFLHVNPTRFKDD